MQAITRDSMRRSAPWAAIALIPILILAAACGGTTSSEADPGDGPGEEAQGDQEYADRMSEEHKDDTDQASPAATAEPAGEVAGERVVYATVDGTEVTGYLARPAGAEGAPAMIVIHEWWGLNENVEAMARRIAGEGYTALAVDLYGGESASDPGQARELMQAVDEGRAKDNLRQAYAYLENEEGAPAIGSIGWCFGGGWSLQTALLFPEELDAAVIYYGRLVTDRERLEPLQVPILGLFGSEDQGIPVASVRELESALEELGKEAEIHVYDGADHAFANPSGSRYDADAAEAAWAETTAFLAERLKG